MEASLRHAVSERAALARRARWLGRPAGGVIAILMGVWIGSVAGAGAAPSPGGSGNSPSGLIQGGLHDAAITDVSADTFAKAVTQAVAANPRRAAAILAAALSIERGDMAQIAGKLVGAAIEGLGASAGRSTVTALVRVGVELQPSAVLFIVRAAVRASSDSLTNAIKNAAIVALKNPSEQVVARVNQVAANAKSCGDDDTSGLTLELGLEAVGEQDLAPALNGVPVPVPPVSPISTPTPTPSSPRSPSL